MKMHSRHANEMLMRLERVMNVGTSEVLKDEVLYWYSQTRLTRNIWRDIDDKWRQELGQKQALYVAEWRGTLIFVWAAGLTTDGSWLQDVRTRAERPIAEPIEDEEDEIDEEAA